MTETPAPGDTSYDYTQLADAHDLPGATASPARRPTPSFPLAEFDATGFDPGYDQGVLLHRHPMRFRIPLLAGLLGAAATVAVLAIGGVFSSDQVAPVAPAPAAAPVREIVTEGSVGGFAAAVGRKVTPSIVSIEVGTSTETGFVAFATGSGVVLSDDGKIVTNHHVIEDADDARVVFQDGTIYDAVIVGSDASTDLAVVEISAVGLVPIELGTSDDLAIGEPAIAVGNPLGLAGGASLTVGVVSAFEREVQTGPDDSLFGMLQTDAPITQGSSGGALVDDEGRLIGITTAIGVSSAGAEGIGFAVPVELVRRITDELVSTGAVHHAYLGVQLLNEFAARDDGSETPAGALVTGFDPDTPSAAEAAGVHTDDVIISLDGVAMQSGESVISALRRMRVGDAVTVEVLRDDEVIELEIVLGERPGEP